MPPGGGEAPRRRKRMPPKPVPTATEDDMQEFVGILAGVRNGNETDIPALLAGKVEFLLSRDIAQLMQRLDSQCANEDERGELNSLFNIVIDFVEQFVSNTALMSEANGQLLREIFEAAASGMTPLDAKMKAMLSGQDPRYTPEFIRFLDAEIVRLRREVAKQDQMRTQGKTKGRFVSESKSIDLGANEEDDDDEDEDEVAGPDAQAALQTLSVIKARISAEMEEHLGEDAWAAQLLSRILQVDEVPLRIVALRTALAEMPDPYARAQFYDVVMSTAADVQDLVTQGQPIDPDLIERLKQLQSTAARELGLKT